MAKRHRRGFSEVAQDLIEETLRLRMCPGIYFADEPAGRDAKVAQLNRAQVDAALRYYAAWPEEIEELIDANAESIPAAR